MWRCCLSSRIRVSTRDSPFRFSSRTDPEKNEQSELDFWSVCCRRIFQYRGWRGIFDAVALLGALSNLGFHSVSVRSRLRAVSYTNLLAVYIDALLSLFSDASFVAISLGSYLDAACLYRAYSSQCQQTSQDNLIAFVIKLQLTSTLPFAPLRKS